MALTINGFAELASPQFLDNNWQELNFELASDHNILQDLIVPESGSGYVYREAKVIGSAAQNRFIYWKSYNDILELIEISTEVVLYNNQVRIRFANSPVIDNVDVIELPDSVIIMVATRSSVHRLHLPHPKTSTDKSVLNELTNEVLYNPANYYILSSHSSLNSQKPTCATSWLDNSMLKCALAYPNGSIFIVQFSLNSYQITTSEIKQNGIIGGIIGGIWSNLLTKNPNNCGNAVFACLPYVLLEAQDVILVTLCLDKKIRLFSTNTKECVCTHSMIPQSSFSQSIVSHSNPITEQPKMKLTGSQIVIYVTETESEFVFLDYQYKNGVHSLTERSTYRATSWESLIDFAVTEHKIWALADVGETESELFYLERNYIDGGEDGDTGVWDLVTHADDIDIPRAKNYITEIFWRNHFSGSTVQKALAAVAGGSIREVRNLEELEQIATLNIVTAEQESKFYDYCLQNHHSANKNIGLIVSQDESVIGLVKRSNPSFICPWLTSVDMVLQGGPYRGIEFSTNIRSIVESLNYISTDLIDDEHSYKLEQKIFEDPANVSASIDEILKSQLEVKKIDISRLNLRKNLTATISAGIERICDQLDISEEAKDYCSKILQKSSTNLRSEYNPLGSYSGILVTFELFKRLVRARMTLARDLLIYINLMKMIADTDNQSENPIAELCVDLYTLKDQNTLRRVIDSLRSYAILVWIAETPIKSTSTHQAHPEVINFVSNQFKFFKEANNANEKIQDSSLELALRQNLLMNFLINGGVKYSAPNEHTSSSTASAKTVSNSFYVTEIALNLCQLLWPKHNSLCLPEFLYTHQLDEHLNKYLDMTENWLIVSEYDRHFIRAANYFSQNRAIQSVEIFNKLWPNVNYNNLIGHFIGLDKEKPDSASDYIKVTPALIYRYFDKLIQLYQIQENYQCLVLIINQCMSLLDGNADKEQQQWVNCFRAKLFQYYLELEEPDEAYHTMVLTTDSSLRTNCLRKFIVSHCEREQYSTLLLYPYIDIKNDFIDILTQKAESSDLSKIDEKEFYSTSFYDLLFASFVSDEEFKRAAEVMYDYAQRLAQEVPGMVSIRKQADCLLVALNALRCVDIEEAFIYKGTLFNSSEESRIGLLKRSYDCESDTSSRLGLQDLDQSKSKLSDSRICCKDIEMKYELTKARLKLLEKDPTGNAIALSPLKAEETILQLVHSNMFSIAMDLAILMKCPLEPILEGLTAKYILLIGSSINFDAHPEMERDLSDIFTHSYNNIDTYNYVANSTSPLVERMWRLIDHYLILHDGISHTYSTDTFSKTFSGTTMLMKVVAVKILSAGYDVPASLKRMYMTRNAPELLRLLIKYDKLIDASDLVIEMVDTILEPAKAHALPSPFTTNRPPVYLPTHLILLLMKFLNEDATNTHYMKVSNVLNDRLNKYRRFVGSS